MMKYKLILIGTLITMVCGAFFIKSASADSISFSHDKINVGGIDTKGITVTYSHDLSNNYTYETHISRIGTYIDESSSGDVYSKHIVDMTAFGMGISRKFSINNFDIVPYIGIQHITLNVESYYLYRRRFSVGPYAHIVNLNATVYSAKTVVLPSVGLALQYNMHKNVGIFIKRREQGYTSTSVGINVRF